MSLLSSFYYMRSLLSELKTWSVGFSESIRLVASTRCGYKSDEHIRNERSSIG